jgi:nucleoside-diphosphate-sugar epimerase
MSGLKYLITGGNGFIGNFIKGKLISDLNTVKTLGKSRKNDYQIDLTKNFIKISEHFDIIIHSASIVHEPSHSNSFVKQKILKDLEITFNFLKCIEGISFKKLIFISSVSVYGLNYGKNIDVSQKISPMAGYGLSKAISEKIFIQNINTEKLLILRLPLVNGQNPKGNIRKALNAIESGKMILFDGNLALKSVLELEDLYSFLSIKSLNFNGIHQLKSYDIKFNDFIKGLTTKKIRSFPLIILKIMFFITSVMGLKKIRNSLIKISSDLTFIDTTKQ